MLFYKLSLTISHDKLMYNIFEMVGITLFVGFSKLIHQFIGIITKNGNFTYFVEETLTFIMLPIIGGKFGMVNITKMLFIYIPKPKNLSYHIL